MSLINRLVSNTAALINRPWLARWGQKCCLCRVFTGLIKALHLHVSVLASSARGHFGPVALLPILRHFLAVMPQLFQLSLALSPAYEKYRVVIFTKSIPNRLGKSL